MSATIPEQSSISPENSVDMRVFDGRIQVGGDETHWTLRVPMNRVYDGVVTIVPGFCGYESSMAGLGNELAQNGYTTLTYDPIRKPRSLLDSFHDAQGIHVTTQETIADEMHAKMSSLEFRRQISQPKKLDLDKKILVPHSMGGLAAARYAAKNSLSVEKLTNVAALGYSQFSLGALFRYYPHIINNSSQELVKAYHKEDLDLTIKDIGHMMKYCLRPQAIFEAISCFRQSVLKDVAHARAEGVQVGYVALGNDLVVRPNENIANYVDHYSVMEGAGHLAPATKPRLVATHVIAALQRLDTKQATISA